ncbi:MAG: hypothetical protein M0R06_20665 [Sphaerochaeta sp.]|jgi:hypothetical protein|nr:hypothetical protein [Sphaerochaeta sp.]
MAFLNEDEQKEFGGNYFQWKDGKTYNLIIGKKVEENFSNGKKSLVLVCQDQDTGETFERKFEFDLVNALQSLGDAYTEEAVIAVTPHYGGKRLSKDGSKEYDKWTFSVSVVDPIQSAQDAEERRKEAAANLE